MQAESKTLNESKVAHNAKGIRCCNKGWTRGNDRFIFQRVYHGCGGGDSAAVAGREARSAPVGLWQTVR